MKRWTVAELARAHGRHAPYAYLDETTKREVRRAILKALCLPGRQVPFASREMPVARGWGSGGLQLTLSVVGPEDVVKIIDQGDDESLNARHMRELVGATAECGTTTRTAEASIVQSRHRLPEIELRADQLLILQLPHPEPLRRIVPDPEAARGCHAAGDYTPAWVELFDEEARSGGALTGADHPVLVNGTALMSPSPLPRHDVLRLDRRAHTILLGAGRLATVVALPPDTFVTPLAFEDRPLRPEACAVPCARCGSADAYRVEAVAGTDVWICSDTDACRWRRERS